MTENISCDSGWRADMLTAFAFDLRGESLDDFFAGGIS